MSEREPMQNPEGFKNAEKIDTNTERTQNKHEHVQHKQESEKSFSSEDLNTIRHKVEHEAISGKDAKLDPSSERSKSSSQPMVTKDLKSMMLNRTLTRVRKELPTPLRAFSKVVHSKPVETISAVGEKTIARPKGLLGGSMTAFVGVAYVLYTAKEYGFNYNLLLFLMLFSVGYIATTLLETIFALIRKFRT